MNTYVNLNAFISSASDVKEEREYAKYVIAEVNRTIRDSLEVSINVVMWEDIPSVTPVPETTIQDMINKIMDNCSIIVIILSERYGEIGKNRNRSNLDIEITKAIDMLQRGKSRGRGITLLTYFRKITPSKDPGTQEIKITELREKLRQQGIFYNEYNEPEDFKERFTHDLYRVSLRFQQSAKKREFLRKFWDLGTAERQNGPQLALFYPLIDSQFLNPINNKLPLWHQKLYPDVSFTEFKALQKILKTIRIAGRINYFSFDGQNTSEMIDEINCVWICIPRNAMGRNRLDRYKHITKFEFVKRNGIVEGFLRWRYNTESQYFNIRSPFSKYLELQRDNDNSNWSKEHTAIIAKDFGIVSRFNMPDNKSITEDGFLKDYFIAGIRGLGTWGAAWFIDRKYPAFENIDENIQLLLEVTYEDGRIKNVIDVSNEPESYFKKQLSLKEINKYIKKFRDDRN